MTIQKKSLISKLNTTKQATTASSTPAQDTPSVSAPVSARFLGRRLAVRGRMLAMKKK